MVGFSPRQIRALRQFVFWFTGQYEIIDVIPPPVNSLRSDSLHATGAITLITVDYLEVPSNFIGNLVDSIVSPAGWVSGTHTQLVM